MRWLAFAVVAATLLHHMGSWLAPFVGLPVNGWFRVTDGAWGATLCGAMLALLWRAAPTTSVRLLRLFMVIGISESVMMTGCRLLIWDTSNVPRAANLCDHWSGLDVTATAYSMYAMAAISTMRAEIMAALRWAKKCVSRSA